MPINNQDNVGTFLLSSSSITIISGMGIRRISLNMLSGTVNYQGSMNVDGLTSGPLTLASGVPVTIVNDNSIDGLTIDASAGSVEILFSR